MKRRPFSAYLTLVLGLVFFLNPVPAVRGRDAAKTLTRTLDPVIARGDATRPFWGKKIDHLRLFARQDDAWVSIPFQVDKVNADGDYFINEKTIPPEAREEAGFYDPPEEKKRELRVKKFERMRDAYEQRIENGDITRDQFEALERVICAVEDMDCLDWNDELAFMARDAGDRAPQDAWLTNDALELEIADPLNGSRAWVYLFFFATHPPPVSAKDYIRYDPENDRVMTRISEIGFMPDKPMIVESIIGKPPGRPVMPDILDRFKLRIKVKPYIFLCIPLQFDENNARGITIGYKDGPVRVLRRNLFWIVIAGVKLPFAPKIAMYFKFYENGMSADSDLALPFNPRYVVCDGSTFTAGLDFNDTIRGARIFTPDNQNLLIDGKMSECEINAVRADQDWIAGYLPDGAALISRLRYDPMMAVRGTKMDLYYLDDEKKRDPPEDEKGRHMIGYTIAIKSLPPTYHLGFDIYTAFDFEPGQVREMLNIDDHPLLITGRTGFSSLPASPPKSERSRNPGRVE